MISKDYYKILGVTPDASLEDIRNAYIRKNKENHPDSLGIDENSEVWKIANDYIKDINEAYRILSDALLKKEYDYYFVKNKHEEKTEKKTNSAKFESYKKTPISFSFDHISSQLKDIILKRQAKDNLYKIKLKGIAPTYSGAFLLLLWFPLLFYLSDSSRWRVETIYFYHIFSLVTSIILFNLISFIVGWRKSPRKWNMLVTPLYFVRTEFKKIKYYYIWDLKNIGATNNYKEGVYQNTVVELVFSDDRYNISFATEAEYRKFIGLVDNLIKTASDKQNQNDSSYFINNNDFESTGIPTSNIPKENIFKIIVQYLLVVILAVTITSVSDRLNQYVSSQPHNIPSSPYFTNNTEQKKGFDEQDLPYQEHTIPNSPYLKNKADQKRIDFNEEELPLPENGLVKYYSSSEPVAPLQIITQSKSNYFIKLEDYYSGKIIATVFIRAYKTVEFNMPLVSCIMKYATGEKWYGEHYLFGPYTLYSKADSRFDFKIVDNQYSGYTVELFLQPSGNLRTHSISPSDF